LTVDSNNALLVSIYNEPSDQRRRKDGKTDVRRHQGKELESRRK